MHGVQTGCVGKVLGMLARNAMERNAMANKPAR
jgi:hypothetical protein